MTSRMHDKMTSLEVRRVCGSNAPIPLETAHSIFASLESELGRPLPADYKELVREHGQCGFEQYVASPVEPRFPLGTRCLVSVFFGLWAGESYFILGARDTYRGRMPDWLVPIAQDPGGNIFVLSGGGEDYGAVYYWDHEHVDLPRGRVTEMAQELEGEGVDARKLSIDQIILAWERRHGDALGRAPGYGNLYRCADSFAAFIEALEPYDPDDD